MKLLLDTHTVLWFYLIVAQAIVEGMAVVSADPKLDGYGITRIW
jgi:PIN domain nuclease of toxin-antitoxin system